MSKDSEKMAEAKQQDIKFIQSEYKDKYKGVPDGPKGEIIAKTIDSLNNGYLTYLIEDPEIDFEFLDAYIVYGKSISTRQVIFDNINNKEILSKIINTHNKKYDIIIDDDRIVKLSEKYKFEIPKLKKSIKGLAKERLVELLKE